MSIAAWFAGMTEVELSFYRGLGGMTGMGAAALFPYVSRLLGLSYGAIAGIVAQFLCLAIGVGTDVMLAGTGMIIHSRHVICMITLLGIL